VRGSTVGWTGRHANEAPHRGPPGRGTEREVGSMYLLSRRVRLSGVRVREAIAHAVEIGQRAKQITGLETTLLTPMFSPGTQTLVFGSVAPDLATLETANDKLMVDDAFNDLVDKGMQYVIPGTMEDALRVVISGPSTMDATAEYYALVRTSIAAGKLADGIELGTEIAKRAEAITGVATTFAADATGIYGGVAWISAYPDVSALERAQMALNGDTSFIEFIDKKAKGVYADDAPAAQVVFRRIPL